MKLRKYSKEIIKDSYDVIIIGSGISGLCSAALLAMEGKSVLILEKHFKVGGYTHTFKRDNYEWDVGIHYIGAVHKKKSFVRRLFDKITNDNLHWNKMSDNYDRIIFPDKSYNFIAPKNQFIDSIKSSFPSESHAIDQYIDILDEMKKVTFKYFSTKALSGISEYLLYNYLTKGFFKYSDQTTYQVLSKITSNEKLIGVLTGQWGDYGLTPKESSFGIHSMIANHYLDGANYPIGGAGMISESIMSVIKENGGEVLISTGVDRISINNNRVNGVILENGERINSEIVISSAGVVNTINKFLKEDKNYNKYKSNLNKVESSGSYVCLYIGFNQTAEELGIKDTNQWIYPGYDHDKNVNDFRNKLTDEFPVLYLSFASSKDPLWQQNHPGTAAMEAITFSSFDSYQKWEKNPWRNRGEDYEEFKEKISQKIISMIYKHAPYLKDKISYYELSTPLSTRDMVNYNVGELYGINHTPSRFRQKWLKPKTSIAGLYLTGQDILTAGLAGALYAGVLTTSVILNKNLFKKI